jgi:hypothetical protein
MQLAQLQGMQMLAYLLPPIIRLAQFSPLLPALSSSYMVSQALPDLCWELLLIVQLSSALCKQSQ